jgi:hypothetical protein
MAAPVRYTPTSVTVSGTTITLTKPTGTASGELLVAFIGGYISATITSPSGWTNLFVVTEATSGAILRCDYLVAGGSEPSSYSWTSSISRAFDAILCRVSGQSSTPFNVYATNTTDVGYTSTHTAPSVTTTINDCLILSVGAISNDRTITSVSPAGYTLDLASYYAGNASVGEAAVPDFVTAGATTACTFTMSSAAAGWIGASLAIAPAAGGSPYTLTASPGAFALTGQAAGLYRGLRLTASPGAFALTGQAAGLRAARRLTCAAGAFALTGQAAGLTYGSVGHYTLTAAAGAFALTGQAAGLFAARRLTCAPGAFLLTGRPAGLVYSGVSVDVIIAVGRGSRRGPVGRGTRLGPVGRGRLHS